MYSEALPYLRCLSCPGGLKLLLTAVDGTGEITAGQMQCTGCGASYAIRDGIGDFLGPPRPPTPAQVVNELRLSAWAYERLWRPFALTLFSGERFPYRRELPLIASMAGVEQGGLYIDVACSNGLYARALTRAMRGSLGHVIGVDHALPMLVEAQRRAREAGLRISYIRASAQALPVDSSTAAGVVIGGSLNEIGDLDMCLSEVHRIMTRYGRFVAMTLARAATKSGQALQALFGSGGIAFYTPEQLIARFDQHQLRTVTSEQHGIVLFTSCVRSDT